MSAKTGRDNFAPLHLGQLVRITKDRHIQDLPVIDKKSWISDITEGVINNLKRTDGGVLASIVKKTNEVCDFYIAISWAGPRLNCHGFRLEILSQAPEQGSLLSAKGGAA